MFKFNFNNSSDTVQEQPSNETDQPAREIEFSVKELEQKHSTFKTEKVVLGENEFFVLTPSNALDNIDSDKDKDLSIIQAEVNHSDLTSGTYEGGLKIWECTFDLAELMIELNNSANLFKGKTVLDLGCGSGLLGLLAYKLGASQVHFQDYNVGVINHFTIPNVFLFGENYLESSRFWCGDWGKFNEINAFTYDLIITSETIYNVNNYNKLHDIFENRLKSDGTIYLAGKCYYFGVGGSLSQFKDLVDSLNKFSCSAVWSTKTGVKREILKLQFR